MAQKLFEYVVKDKDGELYILTAKQRQFLIENEDKRFVVLRGVDLNPAYIVSIKERPAEAIIEMYPCQSCNGNGYDYKGGRDSEGRYPDCSNCSGTGVDLKV